MKVEDMFARIRNSLEGNKLIVLGIKYIPLICTALATLHVSLLLLDIYEPYSIGLAVLLMLVLLILLSIRFNFCRLHKAMIVYMALMVLCICIQNVNGFGRLLNVFRILMLVIGSGLIALSAFKKCDDGCDKQ